MLGPPPSFAGLGFLVHAEKGRLILGRPRDLLWLLAGVPETILV